MQGREASSSLAAYELGAVHGTWGQCYSRISRETEPMGDIDNL